MVRLSANARMLPLMVPELVVVAVPPLLADVCTRPPTIPELVVVALPPFDVVEMFPLINPRLIVTASPAFVCVDAVPLMVPELIVIAVTVVRYRLDATSHKL